ncbi:MAG TPA: LysE family translocator [Janthinobacterium sp.]|nr:LysE family translocator [Janthinobacterium sp.]
MSESTDLWLYALLVFGVIILPGMDMAFVMGSSIVGGRRAGLAAVGGVMAGGVCHMILAATGISVMLKLIPAAFTVMLLLGALYLAWIGWALIRASGLSEPLQANAVRKATAVQSFLRAIATCLLNPKAYVFMLAVFPQFVHAEQGHVWRQTTVLCLITAGTQFIVYGGLALAAARARGALAARPRVGACLSRGVGMVLMMAAALTLYGGIAEF